MPAVTTGFAERSPRGAVQVELVTVAHEVELGRTSVVSTAASHEDMAVAPPKSKHSSSLSHASVTHQQPANKVGLAFWRMLSGCGWNEPFVLLFPLQKHQPSRGGNESGSETELPTAG